MKRIRAPADGLIPLVAWTNRMVAFAALCGVGIGTITILRLAADRTQAVYSLFGISMLLTCVWAAQVPGRKRRREVKSRTEARVHGMLLLGSWLLQIALVGALATAQPAALLPATLIVVQAACFLNAERNAMAAAVLGVLVAQGLSAFLLLSGAGPLALVVVTCVLAIAGAALLHGRTSRRHVAHALRDIDVPIAPRVAVGRRLRFAWLFSAPLLLLAALLLGGFRMATAAIHGTFESDPVSTGAVSPGTRGGTGGRTGEGLSSSSASAGPSHGISTDVDYDQPFYGEGDSLLLRATPLFDGVPESGLGPVYLRTVVLDTVSVNGLRATAGGLPPEIGDGDDGDVDGWTTLVPAADGEILRRWRLEHTPLLLEGAGRGSVVPTLDAVRQVDATPVNWDPDRMLFFVNAPPGEVQVDLRAGTQLTVGPELARRRAQHRGGHGLALPADEPVIDALAEMAREITRDCDNDLERVRAIVHHFSENFDYDTSPPRRKGLESLLDFMDRRSGYCVQYAGASVLMLRSLGISARAVQGFLATEWVAVAEAYDVYPPDVHAWIEVYFADAGWIRFDPTPSDERTDFVRDQRDGDSWLRQLADTLGGLASGDDRYAMRDLGDLLAGAPRALVTALGRGPLAWIALLLIAVGLYALWPKRSRPEAKGRPGEPETVKRARAHHERLLAALAKLGHHQRRGQTPREFAQSVLALRGPSLGAVVPLTERIYAARFGHHVWTSDDDTALDALLDAVTAAKSASA